MTQQSTFCVVMVRPDHFGFNPQTAETNPFMHTPQAVHMDTHEIRKKALLEFDQMVNTLRNQDITVLVLPSRSDAITPDAVFPNNWFSHHQNSTLIIYPILTANRQLEVQTEALTALLATVGIYIERVVDLTQDRKDGLFLESTGSMVLDRVHNVAFAMASPRTIKEEFDEWCKIMGYEGVFIKTPASHRKEVYHTNLEMSIGNDFAVVCLKVLEDKDEQALIRKKLSSLGKDVIEISLEQVYAFCGNVLEVHSKNGDKFVVMSETAKDAFTAEQLGRLEKYVKPLVMSIPTIEEVGGGGVRCMLAEVFPPQV